MQIYLIQNGKRIKKKKTSISKADDPTNPIWNEAFTFNLQSQYLHNAAFEVSEKRKRAKLTKSSVKMQHVTQVLQATLYALTA